MRLVVLPGVFRPISDSLLAAMLREEALPAGAAVRDVCTGSGALAVCAALRGAGEVVAVDVSRRAVLGVRLIARLNGVCVRALRGSLLAPVAGRRFDAIVANPPYVPAHEGGLPARAGRRGRGTRGTTAACCSIACSPRRPPTCSSAAGSCGRGRGRRTCWCSAGGPRDRR